MEAPRELLSRARERFAAQDYHGAAMLLMSITQSSSGYADAHNLLGLSLAMIDRQEDALSSFEHALRLNPNYVEAHLNRAVVLNHLGRLDEANEAMSRAAELGTTDDSGYPAVVANKLANSHAALGDEYRAAGSLPEAIAQYRRALELRPLF
ncbi:MAG TPA: tetratricopeptide repeat protein, partial [Gemmatimonadaceae bacterium]|nr:tetratricopeptide repeat protein [Gemmatimonadaceae bacterium]